MTYPISILGYLVAGMLGAGVFLFLLLLNDKKLAILENDLLGQRKTGIVYIILGGVFAAVWNLSANPDFGANHVILAFSTGLGWEGIAAGLSAGKRVGEINEEKKSVAKTAKILKDRGNQQLEEVEKYFRSNLEQYKQFYEVVRNRVKREIDELREYYEQKLCQ